MIGSGLKKLACEKGLKIDHGVAYGTLGGFAVTLSEGAGYKRIDFSTIFPDSVRKGRVMLLTNQTDLSGLFRIQACEFQEKRIVFIFTDHPGTLTRMRDFLNWFLPLLQEHGAAGADICTQCGCGITDAHWALVDGTAYCLHNACAEKVKRDIEIANKQQRNGDKSSYGMGALGAFLGAALGGIVWALVLYLGYFAAIVGLLIGFLAQKGYDLLHGREGKGKVAILILAIIFGVVLGTFMAEVISVLSYFSVDYSISEAIDVLFHLFMEDASYRGAIIANALTGLLFSGLVVCGMLYYTVKEASDTKYLDLK